MTQTSISKQFKNVISLLIIGFVLFPATTLAARLYLEPSSGQYYPADTFIIEIRLDSEEKPINALETHLTFPKDILRVIELNKNNSILNLWIGELFYSNEEGLISFIGGLPSPGYQGKDGLIGTVTFVVKSRGKVSFTTYLQRLIFTEQAEVVFLDASRVILNDGYGTEASLKTKKAVYHITFLKKDVKFFVILAISLLVLLSIILLLLKSIKRGDKLKRKKFVKNLWKKK